MKADEEDEAGRADAAASGARSQQDENASPDAEPSEPSNAPFDERVTKFRDLDTARQRRDTLIGYGKYALIGVVGAAIIGTGALFLFTGQGGSDPVPATQRADGPAQPVASIGCDSALYEADDPAHPCALKDKFQQQYRRLTTELYPLLEPASSEAFVEQALADIRESETQAIAAFDRSDFTVAVQLVDASIEASIQLEKEIAEAFDRSFEEATTAFFNNNFETANAEIARAVRLRPQDADTRHLQGRIAVLPQVLSLYNKVAEAEIQNQLLDQYRYMEQILALDPEREDIASAIGSLGERIKERRYADLLRQAGQFIDADDLGEAKASVAAANALYPGRPDTAALTRQINDIEKKRRIESLLASARQSEAGDNWPDAMSRYDQVLSEDPTNQRAQNGREKANRIISANNRAVDILNRQDRMQDARVHQRIVEFAEQIKPLTQDSAILADTVASLEQTLMLWRQPRTITVLSDGKSDVRVRRVGVIGTTKSKEIQLKPGTYEFECTRKGYRSNIVQHYVPPRGDVSSITILCDVPI